MLLVPNAIPLAWLYYRCGRCTVSPLNTWGFSQFFSFMTFLETMELAQPGDRGQVRFNVWGSHTLHQRGEQLMADIPPCDFSAMFPFRNVPFQQRSLSAMFPSNYAYYVDTSSFPSHSLSPDYPPNSQHQCSCPWLCFQGISNYYCRCGMRSF